MTTIRTARATIEILGYERLDREGCARRERVTLGDGSDHIGRRHATGPGDVSGPAQGYSERCGWCYLGAPHTADAHAKKRS